MKGNMDEDKVRKRKRDNIFDDSENSKAVMHTPTSMSKLQSNSGRVLRDLTNIPFNSDSDNSLKRSIAMPSPNAVHCKTNSNTHAGIQGVSNYGKVSNKKKRTLNTSSGTEKAIAETHTSTSMTIPLTSIFRRILGDLQNISQNKVADGYQSPADHMPNPISTHGTAEIKKHINVVSKYVSNSDPKPSRTTISGTYNSRFTDPSHIGIASDNLRSPEGIYHTQL
ncbi:Uncharacterized protein Rs2_27697 [Raphanus sativus]|nr:Uncharacterized protein Rs2_27697 [Raphanus sativus]